MGRVAGVVAAVIVVGAVGAGVAVNPLGDPRATTALVALAVGGLALGGRALRRRPAVVPREPDEDPDVPAGTVRIRFSGTHAALSALAAVAIGIALLATGAALQRAAPVVAALVVLAGGVLAVAGAATARRVRRPGELRLDAAAATLLGAGPPAVVPWGEITQVRRSGATLELLLRSERPATSALRRRLRRHLGEPRVTVPCRRIDADPAAVEELLRKALADVRDDHR